MSSRRPDTPSRGSRVPDAGDVADQAASAGVAIQRHPAYRALVTAGLCLYGLVHLLLAWLVVQVLQGRHVDASNQGSLATLATWPLGRFLIGAVAVGMFAMTLWQLLEAALGYQWLDDRKRLVRRVASALRAIVYASIGAAGVGYLLHGHLANGNSTPQRTARDLLNAPGGRLWVALIGVGVAVAAGDQIQRGLRRSFVKYDLQGTPPGWAVRLGMVGWAAKGVVLAVVAILFLTASFTNRAARAGGLDLALKTLRGVPLGQAALVVIAIGLAAFGVYSFVWARYARHDAREPEGHRG